MPYTKGAANTSNTPYNGAGSTASNQQANNWETQYDEATQSFQRDLLTPFVFSGLVATKDGVTASQLDVTAGVAALRQSSDNTLRVWRPTSSTQSTSGHPSTTMYLFLNTDGTFTWQTSSTGPTNSLAIAHVTTDASSNILTVVDDRVLGTSLLASMAGTIAIPSAGKITFGLTLGAANQLMDFEQGFGLFSDNTASIFAGATSRLWISASGTDGSQEVHIGPRTGTAALAGLRVIARNFIMDVVGGASPGVFKIQGGITTSLDAGAITTDGAGILGTTGRFKWSHTLGGANSIILDIVPTDGGTVRYGLNYNTDNSVVLHNYSSGHDPLKIDSSDNVTLVGNVTTSGNISGPVAGGIPTTRNGSALSVPIYTGYTGGTNPSNPPTGSIRIDA